MHIRFDPVPAFDARRLRLQRLNPAGVGIHWRNRRAIADAWISPEAVILVRFSSGRFRRWSRVSISAEMGSSNPQRFTELLRQELDNWLYKLFD